MKTSLIYSALLILIFPFSIFSQQNERNKEFKKEIELRKIGFLTEKMSLTTEEAQVFWPIYNEFNTKKEACMKENRGKKKIDMSLLDTMSEKDLNELAEREIESARKMLELRVQYHENLKKVLAVKKIILLYEAEKEFKKTLLKDLRYERNANRKKH